MATNFHIGQRLSFDSSLCTVRYVGEVAGTTGAWLGVEWDNASRGKHAGVHKGVRYLTCKATKLSLSLCVCLTPCGLELADK